jgi:CPA1 family monovalent cation:H+ antiporter
MLSAFSQFDAFYNILVLVTFVTLLAWRFKFPSTIAFIIAGVLSSITTRLIIPDLSPEVFVSILLPPILFQETLHLDIDGLIDDSDSIFTFAILGTLIMQICVALFTWLILGFSIFESLLFGILIAPTDPVSVIRTFHSLGVVKRFQLIVSGESLFNDGIAIAVYSILVSIITLGSITLFDVSKIIATSILGGVMIGVISGYLVHSVFCWTDDKFAEVLISFIAAFGVFRIAEELHASGVLATVIAGLIINYRSRKFGGLGSESFDMLLSLWDFVGFLASNIAFIFIGMNLDREILVLNLIPSFALFSFIITFRFLMVEGISGILDRFRGKSFPRNWKDSLVWSGLRGAVSIVLVLGVGGLLPNANEMIALTFGIVILSNVVQGMTMGRFIQTQNLGYSQVVVEDESVHYVPLSENYTADGYNINGGGFEKRFFSAPEYFVYETRFGSWMANNVIAFLEILYGYSTGIVATKGWLVNILKGLTNMLLRFLNWINQFLTQKEIKRKDAEQVKS